MAVKSYKRSPWASIRGFTQFKRNMQKLAKLGDERELIAGFTGIAKEIKYDMQGKLNAVLKPPTEQYIKAKKGKALRMRQRGIVAKPFRTAGKGKSFVGIHYRFAPHAHLLEFGTGERMQYSTGRKTGKVPKKGAKTKFAFFRPTINKWKQSGLYVKRVEQVVVGALKSSTRKMSV